MIFVAVSRSAGLITYTFHIMKTQSYAVNCYRLSAYGGSSCLSPPMYSSLSHFCANVKIKSMAHNDLYIVDNTNPEHSVKKYLNEWCAILRQMDIATGYYGGRL
jgi:hypothetical protein